MIQRTAVNWTICLRACAKWSQSGLERKKKSTIMPLPDCTKRRLSSEKKNYHKTVKNKRQTICILSGYHNPE